MTKLAVIRLKGRTNVPFRVRDTFKFLKLNRQNNCNVIDDTPSNRGMLKVVQNHATFGEIDEKTLAELLKTRAKKGTKPFSEKNLGELKFKNYSEFASAINSGKISLKKAGIALPFRLKPAVKGLGRLGLKKSFREGGASGYRGKEINSFIRRML